MSLPTRCAGIVGFSGFGGLSGTGGFSVTGGFSFRGGLVRGSGFGGRLRVETYKFNDDINHIMDVMPEYV